MLSIQEIIDKTEEQRKRIRWAMDGFSYYHPRVKVNMATAPSKTKEDVTASLYDQLSPADAIEIKESLRNISLAQLYEFLAKSGSTGISGAAYLIPVKAHDLALFYSEETDKVPLISRQMVYDWKGDSWTLSVGDDASYVPHPFSSGGRMVQQEVNFSQITLNFEAQYQMGINIAVGDDLREDVADYDILEWHIEQAAKAIGREATDRALTVLKTATDGVGTVNSGTSGDADETKLTSGTTTDIVTAYRTVSRYRWKPQTLICTGEAWGHSISMQAKPTGWDNLAPASGFDAKIGLLDVLVEHAPTLHASADAEGAMTNCVSIVYDRRNALISGRKRWLRIGNYSEPVKGLMGAVILGEQDSATTFDDAIYVLTET